MHKCATCAKAVVKTSVAGHNPGAPCYGCSPSSADAGLAYHPTPTSTSTSPASGVETISLGSYPADATSAAQAASTAHERGSEPVVTPTPFASVPASDPTGNAADGAPSASAMYVTAGSARTVARGGAVGVAVVAMLALVW